MPSAVVSIQDLIDAVQPMRVEHLARVDIHSVACHPAQVEGSGCLFVCMDEYLEYNRWQTWRTHLEALPSLGPVALIAPEPVEGLEVPQLIVADSRKSAGRAARLVWGAPDRAMPVYGVTGTNGKTTTTRLIAHMMGKLGVPCGSIGTLGIELDPVLSTDGTYTTPLAPQLYRSLAGLRDAGAEAVSMEVSSHALALDRVEGIEFEGAVLTNIERDHLDFHGTHEAYAEAKRRLFQRVRPAGWCVLNRASPFCEPFSRICSGQVRTFGPSGSGADLELRRLELHPTHSAFALSWQGQEAGFETRLVGRFQIENAMAAICLLASGGFSMEEIAAALREFTPVCGRMERFTLPNGATAIVDYAHNPDGLRQVLQNCRLLCKGRLHVVFGCGGDRDRGKRPIMGQLAASLADVAWITSDNPRTEDPEAVIDDIFAGVDPGESGKVRRIADRSEAIREACSAAAGKDVVVVAGKGHEDYQIIGHIKHPFSDQRILGELGASQG